MTFLQVWIGYSIFGITVYSAVFVWAVRNGQFTDFDRARYIALKSDSMQPEGDPSAASVSLFDRFMWAGLFVLLLAVIISVFWVAGGAK